MKLAIKIGSSWFVDPRTFERDEAIRLLRSCSVPARMIDSHGRIVAARVL